MRIIKLKDWDGRLESQSLDQEASQSLAKTAESSLTASPEAALVDAAVREIVEAVRREGDLAVKRYAARFDRSSPAELEIPLVEAQAVWHDLLHSNPNLAEALIYARANIERFAQAQKSQFRDFELPMGEGLWAGQRVLAVNRAAVYAPGGRFPLISSVLMAAVPAKVAGVNEVILASPPLADGLPDHRIMAAAVVAGVDRLFAIGGAQAIAALALGTATVPRCDMVVGPGNKYVASAKKLLFGEVGIDLVAGPTDLLVIADETADLELVALDLLAQAEHDPDARARALLPSLEAATTVASAIERLLAEPAYAATANIAKASWEAGGLIIVYETLDEAVAAADQIAPEHLELHLANAENWAGRFHNYGSLFIGHEAAEVLGDYSAGINHTLPTSGSARYTGGLSVRHFLKTVTTLRRSSKLSPDLTLFKGKTLSKDLKAAAILARAEGLIIHEAAALARQPATLDSANERQG